jgi:hypothetical protein
MTVDANEKIYWLISPIIIKQQEQGYGSRKLDIYIPVIVDKYIYTIWFVGSRLQHDRVDWVYLNELDIELVIDDYNEIMIVYAHL